MKLINKKLIWKKNKKIKKIKDIVEGQYVLLKYNKKEIYVDKINGNFIYSGENCYNISQIILPKIGDTYLFEDFDGNKLVSKFIGMYKYDHNNENSVYYMTEDELEIENYCECCCKSEPYIKIRNFEHYKFL